jgi:apolipoprotein N-acyltransferase
MYLFNIATYAPGVDNPPFFSASFLGYLLADNTAFLQLATIGGVYLMSFVVISSNLAFYLITYVRSSLRSRRVFALIGILTAVSFIPVAQIRDALSTKAPHDAITVGLMALYASDQPTYSHEVNTAVAALAAQSPDLIVMPEDAVYTAPETDREGTVSILGSGLDSFGGLHENMAYVRTIQDKAITTVRSKSVLAAQGEYIIGVFVWLAEHTNLSEALGRFRATGIHTATHWGRALIVGADGIPISVAFCVEMLKPYLAADIVHEQGSALVAFMLSHSQFNHPYTLRTDTLRFLKVRAVEAGVPLVASSRATPAYAIDASGRVLASFGVDGTSEWGTITLPIRYPHQGTSNRK